MHYPGSPLITGTNSNNAIQIGVVSYGFECNANYKRSNSTFNVPAQYTDIAHYSEWIQRVLQESLTPDDVVQVEESEEEEERGEFILDITTLGTGVCLGAAMIFFCLSMIIMFMRRSTTKNLGYDRTTAHEIEVLEHQLQEQELREA